MSKLMLLIITIFVSFSISQNIFAGQVKVSMGGIGINLGSIHKKAYFAGGCFWCMEESFDKVDGVIKSVSGYSGGKTKNPTYKDVIYKDTGHVETIEVTYNPKKISYEQLLNTFGKILILLMNLVNSAIKEKVIDQLLFFQTKKQKSLLMIQLKN